MKIKMLLIIFILIIASSVNARDLYPLMFDMASNDPMIVENKRYRGREYTALHFQPALTPYMMSLDSMQTKRLLHAINTYKEYHQQAILKNISTHYKIMSITVDSIEDKKQKMAIKEPLLNLYFTSVGVGEHLLVFSLSRLDKNGKVSPGVFYLNVEEAEYLETLLKNSYVVQSQEKGVRITKN